MAVLRMLRGREAPTVTSPVPAAPARRPERSTSWPPLAPTPAADKPSVEVVAPETVTEVEAEPEPPDEPPVTDVLEPEVTEALGTEPDPAPAPAKKAAKKATKAAKKATKQAAAPATASEAQWVDPVEGLCPGTHPVKAKLSSRIFHLPGGFNYERTIPDRCYLDGPAAEADGFRAAKR